MLFLRVSVKEKNSGAAYFQVPLDAAFSRKAGYTHVLPTSLSSLNISVRGEGGRSAAL